MTGGLALCAAADIPPGETRGFAAEGERPALMAVHDRSEGLRIFVNACPHMGVPLDWMPGRFLNADGTRIICATHGAEFRIGDGYCVRGPCRGESLKPVPARIIDGIAVINLNGDLTPPTP